MSGTENPPDDELGKLLAELADSSPVDLQRAFGVTPLIGSWQEVALEHVRDALAMLGTGKADATSVTLDKPKFVGAVARLQLALALRQLDELP